MFEVAYDLRSDSSIFSSQYESRGDARLSIFQDEAEVFTDFSLSIGEDGQQFGVGTSNITGTLAGGSSTVFLFEASSRSTAVANSVPEPSSEVVVLLLSSISFLQRRRN